MMLVPRRPMILGWYSGLTLTMTLKDLASVNPEYHPKIIGVVLGVDADHDLEG